MKWDPELFSSDAWWTDPRTLGVNSARTKIKASLLRTGMLTLLAAITAFMVLVVVLHNRNTWWTYNLQSEGVARQTIEKYLASVQTGRRFSADQAINKSGVLFTGLGRYSYVATVNKRRIESQYSVESQPLEMGLIKKIMTFETYDTYISNLEHLYEWRLMQGGLPQKNVTKRYDYNYRFLYDLVLINQFGEQFVKQFVFEVRPTFSFNPAFTITAVSEVR
ncbi:MAG: hypothetical protein E6K67_04570 [Nitrospirae bacterium]|nr:MAG: hypothetical protein E6K67_04570 [Nitrospirota bacterium]